MTSADPAAAAPADAFPPPASAPPAGATVAAAANAGLAGLQRSLDRLTDDLAKERRAARRARLAVRVGWLVFWAVLAWLLIGQRHAGGPGGPVGAHTALVELRGEIAPGSEASAERLVQGLRKAFADPGAKAVVLRIDSPGGSPVQAGIVNDEIARLKKKHGKKLYAVVEDTCASGAYYVAAAADEIVVDKASLVGSIGVLMDSFGFTGLMNKLGVERRLITAGENKGILDPFSPLSPRERAKLQTMVDQIHRQFIATVRAGRGARLKETPETFSGLVWTGEESVRNGLADRLGSLDSVAREIVGAPEIVDYTPKDNVAERLAKRIGASIGEGAVRAARELGVALR